MTEPKHVEVGFQINISTLGGVREMTATAKIRIEFGSKEQLSSVLKAIEPETHSDLTDRVAVKAKCENKTLTLTFNAKDTSALRAALNSYLHWVRLARDVLESVSGL